MKIGNGEFLLGDCVNRLDALSDASIDMVVTSPPYDDLRTYNEGDKWTFATFEHIAKTLVRILKPGGVIVWVVNDGTEKNGSKTGTSFRQALHFKSLGLNIHDIMIWNKGSFSSVGSLVSRYGQVFEYMFVLSKGRPKTFNPIRDKPNKWAGTPLHGTVRNPNGSLKPTSNIGKMIPDFGQRFNVWDVTPVKRNGGGWHPALFPLALAQDHILSWCSPGETVLDPFGGSGTTAIAAENTGRKWICVERDADYYSKAVERVRYHTCDDIL